MKIFETFNESLDKNNGIEIELKYITSTGAEWLVEKMFVTKSNYKKIIDRYVKQTQKDVKSLIKHWRGDGEDESLSLYVEPIDDLDNPLWRDVFVYVEDYD